MIRVVIYVSTKSHPEFYLHDDDRSFDSVLGIDDIIELITLNETSTAFI